MGHILDKDTCILWLKGNRPIHRKIIKIGRKSIAVTVITVGELYDGAYRSPYAAAEVNATARFLKELRILPLTEAAARRFGAIRSVMGPKPEPKRNMYLLIASIVMVRGDTLVTNNTQDFQGIRGLKVVNWARLDE